MVRIALLIVWVTGCAGPTRLERAHGTAYDAVMVSQRLHAATSTTSRTPVAGLDGRAAQHLLDRYRVTFEKPSPPPSFVISIGDIK